MVETAAHLVDHVSGISFAYRQSVAESVNQTSMQPRNKVVKHYDEQRIVYIQSESRTWEAVGTARGYAPVLQMIC